MIHTIKETALWVFAFIHLLFAKPSIWWQWVKIATFGELSIRYGKNSVSRRKYGLKARIYNGIAALLVAVIIVGFIWLVLRWLL